jgi:manganese-dependent inorganic pyrophosphatase
VTDLPIYMDIRPWGSMSSIIAHSFFTLRRKPHKPTAGMLLSAILSDTLNLQGPTTTDWDRVIVSELVNFTGVSNVQALATQQFKAKSQELAGYTAMELIHTDQKVFSFKTTHFEGSIGFAVIETTDDEVILRKSPELIVALAADKQAKKLSALFLAVVNIVQLRTHLLVKSADERSLAFSAFPHGKILGKDGNHSCAMDIGKLVSRKKDFIPAITNAVKRGWVPASLPSQ